MSLENELTTLRALRLFDLVDPVAVVAWARARLGEDVVGNGMLDLAGSTECSGIEVDARLNALAEDLAMPPLDSATAGRVAAADAARSIKAAERAPIEGARRIWQIARLVPDVEPQLRVFIGLASEWEDDPENRMAYDEDIRREASFMAERSETGR